MKRITKSERDDALRSLRHPKNRDDFRHASQILDEYLAQVWTESFLHALDEPLTGEALERAQTNGEAS